MVQNLFFICQWTWFASIFFLIIFFFLNFIYLFLAALGLRCCTRALSSCGQQGLLFVVVHGLLIVVASPAAEHRLQAHGLQQLWHEGSVVVARGFQSTGSAAVAHEPSCSAACGIFPDQGSNPCPLHWQADSQPLRQQGSPVCQYFIEDFCAYIHKRCWSVFFFYDVFVWLWYQSNTNLIE